MTPSELRAKVRSEAKRMMLEVPRYQGDVRTYAPANQSVLGCYLSTTCRVPRPLAEHEALEALREIEATGKS